MGTPWKGPWRSRHGPPGKARELVDVGLSERPVKEEARAPWKGPWMSRLGPPGRVREGIDTGPREGPVKYSTWGSLKGPVKESARAPWKGPRMSRHGPPGRARELADLGAPVDLGPPGGAREEVYTVSQIPRGDAVGTLISTGKASRWHRWSLELHGKGLEVVPGEPKALSKSVV